MYDKDSLLKWYQLTEEGFRQKFSESKPEKGKTSSQFFSRLQSYLGRWMKLGNVAATFEEIKDLFLREQFLGVCNKNLALFLKERTPNSVDGMTNLADKYLDARGVTICYDLVKPKANTMPIPPKPRPQAPNQTQGNPQNRKPGCFLCGRTNHFAKGSRQRVGQTVKAA